MDRGGRSTSLLDSQAVREDPVLSDQLFRARLPQNICVRAQVSLSAGVSEHLRLTVLKSDLKWGPRLITMITLFRIELAMHRDWSHCRQSFDDYFYHAVNFCI